VARFQTCPKCRALLTPGTKVCPYCDAGQDAALAISPEQDADATGRMGSWIVAACVVLYVIMVLLDPGRGDKEGNAFEPTNIGILTAGAHQPFYVQTCGQWWRVVSANFVHLDLLHLLMNCVAAFMLIPLAGSTLGVHRTWAIFIFSGIAALTASDLFGYWGGGASGSLCGLVLALAVWGYRRGGFEGRALQRRMLIWAAVILFIGLLPFFRIDNVAHAVGFIVGGLLGWPASSVRARGGRDDKLWRATSLAGLLLVVVVGVGFLAPNVWRGQQRREVEEYNHTVDELMKAIKRVRQGRADPAKLPADLEAGPGDADSMRAAVNRALALARKGTKGKDLWLAERRADEAWSDWQHRLVCSHARGYQ